MKISDVKSFRDMEQFIQEQNYEVECFDDEILQCLAASFRDYQLFFMKKNGSFLYGVEKQREILKLLYQYQHCLENHFSPHIEVELGTVSVLNEVWIRHGIIDVTMPIEKFYGFQKQFQDTGDSQFLNSIKSYIKNEPFCYREFWVPITHPLVADMISVLYEDDSILIFTVKLHLWQVRGFTNYYETLFHVNVERPWEIVPDTNSYWYHYQVKSYYDILKEYGQDYVDRRIQEKNKLLKEIRSRNKMPLVKERKLCK